MKHFTTALFIALAGATSVSAQSAEVKRACDAVNMLAPLVMQQRQSGAPIAEIMPYANMAGDGVKAVVERMIQDAYAQPVAGNASGKSAAAQAFQQKWVQDCYASYN